MKDEKKAPKLRFKGFTDDWEQCKLSDISEKSYEKNTDNKYSTVLTNSAEYGIVKQRDFFDKDIANSSNISGYYVVRKNYFVYNPRISNQAKFGPINRNKLDESGIMSPLYLVFTVHDIDESFLETLFQTTTWHRFMYQNGDTGARADRFAIKDSTFMSMPIKVPSLEEQHKLALAFQKLDQTITLHEDKKRQLERIKSALLQKMFANKSEYPAIRFEGFSAEWEQCKLGDVANFSKGTGYSKSDLKGTGSPIILYGRLYTKYETIIQNVNTFVVPKSGSVFSKGGEVIVPGSGETAEDISIASVVEPAGILLGGDLNIIYPNSDLDPAFLAITISNGKPHFDMARRAQGKSVVHLHNADLKHILLKTPNLSEQKRISKIFESLDQTITLHDQKLSFLKRLKQTLLQKMFI
ncbi:restriction endonuclease subunit S [Lactobacillus delbrueckii]|uniref:restriction endonuclease subunit S n=1 Tax=Lactobacillus delbrueckii TaxID=1584 RepID=UPI0039C46242